MNIKTKNTICFANGVLHFDLWLVEISAANLFCKLCSQKQKEKQKAFCKAK